MRSSLLASAAIIGAAFLLTTPAVAQEIAAPPTNATATGSADTGKRADMPPKTADGKNRNAGVIETDKGRVAGDPDANDAKDKAKISDAAIENAVEEGAQNASTKSTVGGTKPSSAQSGGTKPGSGQPTERKAATPPDGRASSGTETK